MGVMLSAALTLTNCTAEMDQPAEAPSAEGTFEIIANTADTRTVNDGMSTKWEAGDTINVFHAVAGSEDYVNDGEFEIAEADLENGRFTGNLSGTLEADGTYDWYAFFPYTRQKTSPADAQTGYAYIGYSEGLNQTGYDNMSALRRTVCPLYGVAKAVAGDDVPGITMQHLSSVIAVEVTNGTDAPLTVTSVSFTAPEPIVGSFYIAFADGEPVYTPSDDNYVKSTAVVNVKEGTALAKGETATVYIAVKPFTAAEDDDLILTVNGYEKYLTMTKDVTFHAGKIKTLKFKYDYVPTGNIATFDFNANEWGLPVSEQATGKLDAGNIVEPLTSGDVTMTAYNSSDNKSKIRMWQGGSKTDLRAYKKSSLAFSVPAGYVITRMTFNADAMPDASVSTPSGTFASKKWTGKSNPVIFTFADNSETIKINTITVEYEAGTGASPELPSDDSGDDGDDNGNDDQDDPSGAPESLITATIAEFLAAAESADVWYKLTGEITSIKKEDYGNFYIKDETGEVYIYGMTNGWVGSNDKSFSQIGLKVGDVVTLGTLRGSHNDEPQGGGSSVPAYYISHEAGEEDDVTLEGSGTEDDPYTVADVIALYNSGSAPTDRVWVTGEIVGHYKNNKFYEGTDGETNTNIALGTSTENIPVQLPQGDIRNALNLADHSGNLGKTVAISAKIEKYFSVAGLKSPNAYKLD